MEYRPILKANEKLPRGSYFYIQVGHRFYAGEEAEFDEVEIQNNQPRSHSYWSYWEGWARGPQAARARKKGTLANYLKSSYEKRKARPVEKTIERRPTGRLMPRLADTVEQAKKYRRQDLVQSACERLKGVYGELDVNVTVHYHGGESK